MDTDTAPSRTPIWPAVLFLIWDLLGCAAFAMQSTQDLATLARTDPLQARIWSEMPTWVWASYAVAVLAGTAGAIALMLRRRIGIALSAMCILAVVIQFGWTFLGTGLLAERGVTTAIFPAFVFIMALAQFLYARWLGRRGALR